MNNDDVIKQLLENCKISVKLVDKAKSMAVGRANIDFGVFEINGFLVLKTEEGVYWVKPPTFPSFKAKGNRGNIFFTKHQEDFWNPLTEKVLAEFHIVYSSEIPNFVNDIDVDSIPF